MIFLPTWTGILVGMGLIVVAVFLTIWWKQHTFQWTMVLTICLIVAPLLSWWSGEVFVIEPYRGRV